MTAAKGLCNQSRHPTVGMIGRRDPPGPLWKKSAVSKAAVVHHKWGGIADDTQGFQGQEIS